MYLHRFRVTENNMLTVNQFCSELLQNWAVIAFSCWQKTSSAHGVY